MTWNFSKSSDTVLFQTVFYLVTDMWSLEYRSFSTINLDLFDFSVDSPKIIIKGWYSAQILISCIAIMGGSAVYDPVLATSLGHQSVLASTVPTDRCIS
jgi:hypothetical protein